MFLPRLGCWEAEGEMEEVAGCSVGGLEEALGFRSRFSQPSSGPHS